MVADDVEGVQENEAGDSNLYWCMVDVTQAVRDIEPRGMVAMVRYLRELMRNMCEYAGNSLQYSGFPTADPLCSSCFSVACASTQDLALA